MTTFKPEAYGAAGNGTTNDSAAFASMNTAIAANGGGEVILEKTYYLPNGWVLPSNNLVIDGLGRGVIKANAASDAFNAISAVSKRNIVIRDLRTEVPLTNLRTGGINILFTTCSDVRFSNVRTSGGVAGIWFITGSRVVVENCYVYQPKADGIHFGHGSVDCKAIGNTVEDAGDDSFATTYYQGFGRSRRIVFANNISLGGRWGSGFAVHGAEDVEIVGNYVYRSALAGIQISYNQDAASAEKVKVSGNRIQEPCQVDRQPESYWWGTNPAADPVITAPSFMSGISIAAGIAVEVTDNTIQNVSSASGGARDGMFITMARHLTVRGNVFRSVSGYGIRYAGAADFAYSVIADNVFDTVTREPVALLGTGYSGPISVVGNKSQNVAHLAPYAQVNVTGMGGNRLVVAANVNAEGRGVIASGSSVLNVGNAA